MTEFGHRCEAWTTQQTIDADVGCVFCAWQTDHHQARVNRVRVAELERLLEQALAHLDRRGVSGRR